MTGPAGLSVSRDSAFRQFKRGVGSSSDSGRGATSTASSTASSTSSTTSSQNGTSAGVATAATAIQDPLGHLFRPLLTEDGRSAHDRAPATMPDSDLVGASRIGAKIRQKRRGRALSIAHLPGDQDSLEEQRRRRPLSVVTHRRSLIQLSESDSSSSPSETSSGSLPSREPVPRAANFQLILDRFQKAEKPPSAVGNPHQQHHYPRISRASTVSVASLMSAPTPTTFYRHSQPPQPVRETNVDEDDVSSSLERKSKVPSPPADPQLVPPMLLIMRNRSGNNVRHSFRMRRSATAAKEALAALRVSSPTKDGWWMAPRIALHRAPTPAKTTSPNLLQANNDSPPPPPPPLQNLPSQVLQIDEDHTTERYDSLVEGSMTALHDAVARLWPNPPQSPDTIDWQRLRILSEQPTLTKGSAAFFEAALLERRQRFTSVTLIVCASTIYTGNSTRGERAARWALPTIGDVDEPQFLGLTLEIARNRKQKISVLPRMTLASFHSLAANHLYQSMEPARVEQQVSWVVLQLLSALKALQADGHEWLSLNFCEFVLGYAPPPSAGSTALSLFHEFPRLFLLPESVWEDAATEIVGGGGVGVCRYALRALSTLLHHKMDGRAPKITQRTVYSAALKRAADLLEQDTSASLTQAKNVLEWCLFGGGGHSVLKTEKEARLWLDAQRHAFVCQLLVSLAGSLRSHQNSDDAEETAKLSVWTTVGDEAAARQRADFLLSATPRSVLYAAQLQQSQH